MKTLLVAAVLCAVAVAPAVAFDWNALVPETGGACMVTANGLGRAALTASYPLYRAEDWRVDFDLLLANDGSSGAGVSAALSPIATWLGFRNTAPFLADLADKASVGTSLLYSGDAFNAGLYWKLRLVEIPIGPQPKAAPVAALPDGEFGAKVLATLSALPRAGE